MYHPLRSLREGHWFKLICGASFQHLPAVRSLTLAYALAGADCIDVAADPAVVKAACDALQAVKQLASSAQLRGFSPSVLPWLMVSLNDGEDPHFRKAFFAPENCPPDCDRPCEKICPAQAITFGCGTQAGVLDDRCYGCGRCLPICPLQHITTRSSVFTPSAVASLILSGVDAVEIHTQLGHFHDFQRLWAAIAPFTPQLKVVSISCPDGDNLIDYLRSLYDMIAPLPCALIWQTDGRPMSGDIGAGATRAAVKLGQKVLASGLPGHIQLAGGTNLHTVTKLQDAGLLQSQSLSNPCISGVAYGSYARVLLSPVLDQLERWSPNREEIEHGHLKRASPSPRLGSPSLLEDNPELLWQAVHLAHSLVFPLKAPMNLKQTIPR